MEVVRARGHPNITAKHRTTMEVTRDPEITRRADCVIGVSADKGLSDVAGWLKSHLLLGLPVRIIIEVEGSSFSLLAFGDERLTFESEREIVIRRSEYVDGRTLAVRATASARDLPRSMVRMLARGAPLLMRIEPLRRTPGLRGWRA